MRNRRIDATDERILRLLRRNARASYRDIGEAVGLSANAVTQRMRRLEADQVIRGYTTLLDPAVEAPALLALVQVHISTGADMDELERGFAAIPAVADAVQAVRVMPGVTDLETRLVLRQVLRR
jgi:Lrp/AsnC family leucine-responsive transcriptional regulator